jgi:predicted O-methyltransferase YrrM
MPSIRWSDDEHFSVGDTQFTYSFRLDSTSADFRIRKHRPLVEDLVDLLEPFERPNIFELGIAAGGSAALLALLTQPKKLVAVDISRPVAGLEQFIREQGLSDVVRTHYEFDQGDRDRLAEIIAADFAGEPIDLVIDDASHRLRPSRASFEAIFPHVRPGGLYVIEDWNWQEKLVAPVSKQHTDPDWLAGFREAIETDAEATAEFERRIQDMLADPGAPGRDLLEVRFAQAHAGERTTPPTRDELLRMFPSLDEMFFEAPLMTLVFELVLARAASLGGENTAIDSVELGPWWAIVRRGTQPLTPGEFRVRDLYSDVHELLAGQDVGDPAVHG